MKQIVLEIGFSFGKFSISICSPYSIVKLILILDIFTYDNDLRFERCISCLDISVESYTRLEQAILEIGFDVGKNHWIVLNFGYLPYEWWISEFMT